MFVFNRSAAAVILPIALLVAAVLWSGGSSSPAPETAQIAPAQGATVASVNQPHHNGG